MDVHDEGSSGMLTPLDALGDITNSNRKSSSSSSSPYPVDPRLAEVHAKTRSKTSPRPEQLKRTTKREIVPKPATNARMQTWMKMFAKRYHSRYSSQDSSLSVPEASGSGASSIVVNLPDSMPSRSSAVAETASGSGSSSMVVNISDPSPTAVEPSRSTASGSDANSMAPNPPKSTGSDLSSVL